ncbi:hypothetical protein TARUN_7526, partial [Trichoderma arundinaceum]
LDFLAQSIFPYTQPSLRETSQHKYTIPYSFVAGSGQHTIPSERVKLIQIISRYNDLDNIIWGPWSSKSSRPSPEVLTRFQMELLNWRDNSPLTFESCYESLTVLPECNETLDALPIPPKPLSFQSALAALNAALYNNYMACSFSMLSNDSNFDHNALCTFHFVYQNLRIAEGLTAASNVLDRQILNEDIDISISLLLYLGFRRCYSRAWQKWTIQILRQCGRQGLLDGSAFANTLDNLCLLQLRAELQSSSPRHKCTLAPSTCDIGLLHERILPLLQPRDDSDNLVAYYLRHDTVTPGQKDIMLHIIARATWKQDEHGNIISVNFDYL